jgi:hypothetical protein
LLLCLLQRFCFSPLSLRQLVDTTDIILAIAAVIQALASDFLMAIQAITLPITAATMLLPTAITSRTDMDMVATIRIVTTDRTTVIVVMVMAIETMVIKTMVTGIETGITEIGTGITGIAITGQFRNNSILAIGDIEETAAIEDTEETDIEETADTEASADVKF